MNLFWQRWFNRLWLGSTLGLALFWSMAIPTSAQVSPAAQQGYVLLERGWVNDAIAAFRQALQSNPQSLDAKLGLAIAYQRAGQDANAWQAYQQVLSQDPNNRRALTAVGQLGSYRPEWQPRGIQALTTLLTLSPDDKAARAQRALLYGYQSQFADAIADYMLLLESNPTPDVVLGAAQIYAYSGDYQGSLSLFQRYLATGKPLSNSAATAYALALEQTGDPAKAIQILEPRLRSLTTLDDTAIQMRASLASAYAANRQIDQALATLEPLRDRPGALLPLARALSTIGRQSQNADLYETAVAYYQQVLQQTPKPSAGLLIEIADVLSDSPESQAAALPLYQQAAAQQPHNQSVQVKQLILEQQLGQLSKADLQSQLQQILGTLPTAASERRSLALALLRIDPPNPEFLPLFQAALQDSVDVPFFNFRIAQIYLQQGDRAAARQALAAYVATPVGTQDPASDFLLAEMDRQEGNLDASAKRYQAIVDRNLGDQVTRDASRGLAGIRLAQGRPEEALKIYQSLVAANPEDGDSQLGQAGVAYRLKKISQAEAETVLNHWLTGHSLAEPPSELFLLVGALPADAQRESLYQSLLETDPNNIAINLRWVQLLAQRDPAIAQAKVNQLLSTNPDQIGVYFIQGELGQAIGNLPLASQSYEAILEKQPNNADALSALGGVRFQQKRFAEAKRLYTQVLAQRPDDFDTQRILAELSLAQDQPIAALEQFQTLQQSHPDTPDFHMSDRIQQLQIDLLRRRGFQPYWERY
ncbi:MAG TPA: tetratricopeptide repeat protein [Coleofasciculaceae cyanobacterium]